jgi:plasmid stabilization system protein ParE
MSSVYKVVQTQHSKADALDATQYIVLESGRTRAVNWITGLERTMLSLDTFPNRGAPIPENEHLDLFYRHLIYHSHRIIYRVDEEAKTVIVIRVYHSARRPLSGQDLTEN